MKTISFITLHYYPSKRRAGFHNLADAAHNLGFRVNFVTVALSFFSYLRRDYRSRMAGIKKNYQNPVKIRDNFYSFVHFTPWHPHNLIFPFLNNLTHPIMDNYGQKYLDKLLPFLTGTNIFVFESCAGLFLMPRLKQEYPKARMIYRVSDDIRALGSTHPRLIELEAEIAPLFDIISVPSRTMTGLFKSPNTRLDTHGLDKTAFDLCTKSPYPAGINAIFVGVGHFDYDFIAAAAKLTYCTFHIIGPVADKINLPNVIFYGEMPFLDTIAYIKFADIALHNLPVNKMSPTRTDSLKIIQYRYCGLPIICPDHVDLHREGVFYYTATNENSCQKAIKEALRHGKHPEYALEVKSWEELAKDLF